MIGERDIREVRQFPHEVKIFHSRGTAYLLPSYDLTEWLKAKGLRMDKDWKIDMHGGNLAYTSFYFKDADQALITKLTHGGQ